MESVLAVPTLFWFVPEEFTDTALDAISTTGKKLNYCKHCLRSKDRSWVKLEIKLKLGY